MTLQGKPPSLLERKHFRVPISSLNAQIIIDRINAAYEQGGFDFQGSVISRLADPPGAPNDGDRYLIIAPATGVWAGHEDDIVEWSFMAQEWVFTTPTSGTIVWVEAENEFYVFNGTSWNIFTVTPVAPGAPDASVQFNDGTGGFAGSAELIFDGTNLGIGTDAPAARLHVRDQDTGLTPDPNSSLLFESTTANRFLAFIAPNASFRGILFGNASNSADGGILYDNTLRALSFRTSGNTVRLTIDNVGDVGIGTTVPNGKLHILTGGVSGYTGVNRGAIITDSLGPRVVFENTGLTAGNRVMLMRYEGEALSIDSINDAGSAFDVQNIISAHRDGQVSIGAPPIAGVPLNITSTFADGEPILRLSGERAWQFQQEGTGAAAAIELKSISGDNKEFRFTNFSNVVFARFRAAAVNTISFVEGATDRLGVGIAIANSSAKLDVVSVDKGFLPPRVTEVQRDAIASPVAGLEVFNTSTTRGSRFDGTVWEDSAFQPENRVYVTSAADLPAPSAGVITLEENTEYVFYNDDPTASQKTVTLSDRIVIPDAGGCRLTSTGVATVLLSYSGTGNFFTTTDNFTGFFSIDNLFVSAPTGTLFDISGVLPVGSEFFPRLFCWSMGFFNTDTIGTIKNISFNYNVGAFFDCGDGLVLENMNEALISDIRFIDWKNQVNAVMITMKGVQTFPKIAGCIFKVGTNETLFDIQPNLPVSDILVVAGNGVDVGGTAFQTGTSGAFTAVADQSESGTTIDSVAGTAFGESLFTTAVAHGLVVDEEAIHTGFADSNYNGTFRVLEVISATQYRVHTLFTATGTGSLASDIIEFTSTAHGLIVGDAVQITDSTVSAYNVGGTVIGATANTFQINGVFSATATGNWNTDSLTQKDSRVESAGNSGLADSVDLAFGEMNVNAVATVIAAANTYQAIDVSGLIDSAVTSRFELTDAMAGIYTYRGAKEISAKITAIISATKSGSTAIYRFTISVNGAIPTFVVIDSVAAGVSGSNFTTAAAHNYVIGDTVVHSDMGESTYGGTFKITSIVSPTVYEVASITFIATDTGFASVPFAPMEVKAVKVAATVGKFETLVNGDTVQIMGAGDGTSNDLTITDFLLEVEG